MQFAQCPAKIRQLIVGLFRVWGFSTSCSFIGRLLNWQNINKQIMNQIKWYGKTCLPLWIEPSMFGYISTMIDCRMITWFYIIRWFTVIVYQIVSSKYTMNNNVSSLFCRKWRSNDRLVNGVIYPHTQCNDTVCCVIDIDISRNVGHIVINYLTQKIGMVMANFSPQVYLLNELLWALWVLWLAYEKMQRQLLFHFHCKQLRKHVDWTDKFNKYYITRWNC